MKGCVGWQQHVGSDTQLHHCISVHDVDAAAIVNQNFAESDILVGPNECWVHHQSIASWGWHDSGVIFYPSGNLLIRLVHIFWHSRHNSIDLHLAPRPTLFVSCLGHEHHITMMSFMILILSVRTGIAIVASVVHLIHIIWFPSVIIRPLLLLLIRLVHRSVVCPG